MIYVWERRVKCLKQRKKKEARSYSYSYYFTKERKTIFNALKNMVLFLLLLPPRIRENCAPPIIPKYRKRVRTTCEKTTHTKLHTDIHEQVYTFYHLQRIHDRLFFKGKISLHWEFVLLVYFFHSQYFLQVYKLYNCTPFIF